MGFARRRLQENIAAAIAPARHAGGTTIDDVLRSLLAATAHDATAPARKGG